MNCDFYEKRVTGSVSLIDLTIIFIGSFDSSSSREIQRNSQFYPLFLKKHLIHDSFIHEILIFCEKSILSTFWNIRYIIYPKYRLIHVFANETLIRLFFQAIYSSS